MAKVEIEIGDVDPLTKVATQKHLQFLMNELKPSGIAKLMGMFTGAKKIMVTMWLKSQGVI